jgi:hypothetical protein
MTKQATNADSGIRNHRVEFVRETAPGEAPADPEWQLYSDTLQTTLQWEADAQIEAQRGVGDYEVEGHFAGAEDHSLTIEYDLQRFFVDTDGNPLDAAGDAIVRDNEGDVANTHTIVDRADYGDTRTYVVARGAYPNVDSVSGDPGSGLPIGLTLAYEAKSVRMFKVEQPDGVSLTVRSTSSEDTTQTLTLESDSGTTTADVSLDGTTGVSTTDPFDSLDALELDADTQGDVVIEDDSGNELARIPGAESFDGVEGALGVPTLGAGSHKGSIGSEYETFLDDRITKGGSELAAEVRSAEFTVTNNYEKNPVAGTKQQAIHTGNQDVEFIATVAGDFEHHETLTDHLSVNEFDLVWEFDGGTVTFTDAVLTGPGTVGPSSGDVISTIDNTFTSKGVDVSAN